MIPIVVGLIIVLLFVWAVCMSDRSSEKDLRIMEAEVDSLGKDKAIRDLKATVVNLKSEISASASREIVLNAVLVESREAVAEACRKLIETLSCNECGNEIQGEGCFIGSHFYCSDECREVQEIY